MFLNTGVLMSLSEQQIVDCSSAHGNQGCNGGNDAPSYYWIKANKGLCRSVAYPYVSGFTGSSGACQTVCTPAAGLASYTPVTRGSDAALARAISTQPTYIAMDGSSSAFQSYGGGVISAAAWCVLICPCFGDWGLPLTCTLAAAGRA